MSSLYIKNTNLTEQISFTIICLTFQKFKATENKMQDQQELITQLKQELEKSKLSLYEEKNVQKKISSEVDQVKAELLDIQRAERVVRVDLEQATKRVRVVCPLYCELLDIQRAERVVRVDLEQATKRVRVVCSLYFYAPAIKWQGGI